MEKLFVFIAALLLCGSGIAQNNPEVRYRRCIQCSNFGLDATSSNTLFTYDTSIVYLTNLIADDYGPRQNDNDVYDWHGGIDYNSGAGDADMGDLILAIRGGAITGSLGSGYKRLIVQAGGENFGYGHFFTNDSDPVHNWPNLPLRSGGCWLKLDNDGNRCIVMVIDGDTTAIGTETGIVNFNGKNFVVSDSIVAGAPIGPTGYSVLNSGAHLHLFANPNNATSTHDTVAKNPLQFVDYLETTYDIQILKATNYSSNLTEIWSGPSYPGTQRSHAIVRPTMNPVTISGNNRYDRVYDVNKVELLIKREWDNEYQVIKGAKDSSEIRVGGLIGESMYPDSMYRDGSGLNGGGTAHIGNTTRQGIRPFVYATNNAHPYDDFYFADFITRIDTADKMNGWPPNIAYCTENARYPDGPYQMIPRVTTIRDSVYTGLLQGGWQLDPVEFVLDNFKPYVKKVEVSINGELRYRGEWLCSEYCSGAPANAGSIYFDSLNLMSEFDPNEDYSDTYLDISVETSEPLDWLNLSIPNYGYEDLPLTPLPFFDQTHWDITLSNFPLVGGINLRFVFDGRDFSDAPEEGNSLLNLEDKKYAECTPLPNRKGNTATPSSWNSYYVAPYGEDYTHIIWGIEFPCPAGGNFTPQGAYKSLLLGNDCLLVDFDFQFNPATCSFDFTDLSEGSISTWFWDFDDGAVSNLQHPTHAFPATGCYDVTLTITNEDGVSSSITKEVCFEGMEYPYVKEVSMYADDGTGSTLIYHGVWEDMGDCIFFEKETYPYNLSAMATASVTVDVVTSKPVEYLDMVLSGLDINCAASDGENWTGLIPAGFFEEQVSNGSIYQPIFFQGQDMEGNPLMELNSMSTSMVQCVIVPEWTAACTWEPAPVISPNGDQVHVLEMHCEWVDFALDVSEGTISLVYNETPIKVLWTGPGITPQNMYNFVVENAEFGQYCATVLFANGCALNKCLIFPGQMLLIPEYTSPCPGMSDGSICVNVYGGSGAYALTWQSGSTGNCLTGLEPGDGDCLTVVDLVYGEVVQECFDVPVFEPPMIELASLDPPCPDGTGGQICVNVSGSNPPFMVEWPGSGAMGFCNETLQDGELICAVVTDGCGVEVEECFPAPAYSGMQVSNLEVVHPIENCPNGMISFDIAGGIPPYSVSWTSEVLGGTLVTEESELTNLPAGYYEIAVSDACGFTTFPFYVQLNGTQPAYTILAHVGNITHVCSQDDDSGSIDLNVSSTNDGVLGDLNYQWSNGATTQDISNLLPGTYIVTVTDPKTGCNYTTSATVESKAIDPAWFFYSFILPSCANEATGSIFLNPPSKNDQGFSFLWSNGETGRYPQQLPSGTNTVTITNQYGCSIEMTFEVGEVASPEIMLTELQHAYTEGESNGKISVTAKGSNFTYQWSNGGVGSSIGDLPVGTYTVTVTNSMGCSSQATFKIDYCIVVYAPGLTWENFTYIQLSRAVTPQSAPGAADGAIDLTITQGSAPIYYYWTGPGGFKSNAQDISGLEEGNYCATVTNGCDEVNFCEWVVNCDDFEVELTVTQNGSQEGICWTPCSSPIKVTATVSNYHGALDMMEYEWEFIGEENPLVGNSSTRTFSWDNLNAVNWANLKITVTDEAGCSKSTTINLFNFAEFPSSENNFVFNYLSQNQPGEADALQYFLTAAEGYEHTLPGYIIGCGFNYYCDGELVCSDGLVANSCTTSSGTSCNCPAAEGALGVFSCGGANSIGVQHIATYVEQLPNCEVK